MDSLEEAILDFVKNDEKLYARTNEQGQEEMPVGEVHQQLQVFKVYKTWFESQRTQYFKKTQYKSGQATKEMTER